VAVSTADEKFNDITVRRIKANGNPSQEGIVVRKNLLKNAKETKE